MSTGFVALLFTARGKESGENLGTGVVEVWLEIDEQELAGNEQGGQGAAAAGGSIISLSIPPR